MDIHESTRRSRRWTLAIGLALAAHHAAVVPAVSDASTDPSRFELELVRLVNDYRERQGLQPLTPSPPLAEIAGEHSRSMAERGEFSHSGFRQRFERSRSRQCVENLARNFATPAAVLAAWQNSPSHDVNLLDAGVSRVGIATSERYVTYFACR